MPEKRLRRPTKAMMLAVNATLAGDRSGVKKLMAEHGLDGDELERRVALRNGEAYDLGPRKASKRSKPRKQRRPRSKAPEKKPTDLASMVKGWKIARLLDGIEALERELARHPEEEVRRVRDARASVVELRERLKEAEEALDR